MMPEIDDQPTDPGFFSRLGGFLKRLLLAFLKLGLIFIVLAVLAGGAWLIYQEIDRSFDSVTTRMDADRERIRLAEEDINSLTAGSDAQQEQIADLETALAGREADIAALESDLAAGQEQQEETLIMLEERLDALIANTEIISGNVTVLNEGLVSLQSDTTTNVSDIDALGGELDALQSDLEALDGQLEAVQTELSDYSAEEFNRMGQALTLFRVWQMVSRARLRLVEQNAGLAADDVDTALVSIEDLLAAMPEEAETTAAAVELVQQRLTLAAGNLPDDPATAARDLETAWEDLDAALAILFGEQPLVPQEQATPEPTPTATT